VHGTGLGLPLVKAAAEAHGGSVEVESNGTRGSRFSLRLPVQDAV
jgi:signal transduction histidine kinase